MASRLLTLPRELRDEIYYCTFHGETYDIADTASKRTKPATILTCKQTHIEALDVFYKLIDFYATLQTRDLAINTVGRSDLSYCEIEMVGMPQLLGEHVMVGIIPRSNGKLVRRLVELVRKRSVEVRPEMLEIDRYDGKLILLVRQYRTAV